MIKIKVLFCEYWFKSQQGQTFYKAHFQLDAEKTAFVPVDRLLDAGSEIVLKLSRGKDGRANVSVAK